MEKLSRVKKYEELRKSIETENAVSDPTRDSMGEEQQEALKKFDSSILKKVNITNDEQYVPEREKEEQIREKSVIDDTFTNEYLDDFIREVREYNIKKGNRESEDTQIDILSQLNAANRAKRAHYVEDIKEDSEEESRKVLSRDTIAQEVQNLLKVEPINESELDDDIYATTELILEDDTSSVVEMKAQDTFEITPEKPASNKVAAKKIIQPSYEMEDTQLYDDETQETRIKERELHEKLMEETQQLRVQMDEYEDELTDLSDGVEKNNKILNFILCFLILVLLAILGFIGYYIWKGGNI